MLKTSQFLVALALAGCVSIEEYPKEWGPPPALQSGCPTIAGTYLNAESRKGSVRALSWLFGEIPSLQSDVTWVSIDQSDQRSLIIRYWQNKVLRSSRVLSELAGDYSCTEGKIQIRRSIKQASAESGGAWAHAGNIVVTFLPTQDYLVAEWRGSLAGGAAVLPNPLFVPPLIPLLGYETHWYRFKRIQED